MADGHPSPSPLDGFADTVGERTTAAFKQLGNDSRLAILLALWEAKDPVPPVSASNTAVLTFSELRERVGMRDSSQFNYHLEHLTGILVEKTEQGYRLTPAADHILRSVFGGTFADASSFEGESIDAACYRCGASTVIDYCDTMLAWRCTSCEGAFREPDDPPGLLAKFDRPPVGLAHRTAQEFQRDGNTWDRHRFASMMEGVCPDCSGSVTATVHICDDHDTHDETLCEQCGSLFEVQLSYTCEVCKFTLTTPGWAPIFREVAVVSFFYDHGLDYVRLLDEWSFRELYDAVASVRVQSETPLKIGVTVELDDDRLTVTLDGEARGIDVTVETGTTA